MVQVMRLTTRTLILLAAAAGFTGVLAGTFGAHGLEDRLAPERLATFEVGVRYHLIHAVALLGLGALAAASNLSGLQPVGWLFALGIVLFSGSLYAFAITEIRWLAMVTPFGGGLFILGWLMLGVAACRSSGVPANPTP